ncbi:MAG: hypothetical protein ABI318_03215 [Chthoniobacteraceae bacterium]
MRPVKRRAVTSERASGKIFATPAAADGALILRTDQALYRIGGAAKP